MSAAPPNGPGGAAGFPWDEAMAAGLGVLRLSPKDFWSMSPRELAAALGPFDRGTAALPRAALHAMMRRFPDERR